MTPPRAPRRLFSTCAALLVLGAANVFAQPTTSSSISARAALERLRNDIVPLARDGYSPTARRPIAVLLDGLRADAAEMLRDNAGAPMERARLLERFARDADAASDAEKTFWSSVDIDSPALAASTSESLRTFVATLLRDFNELDPNESSVVRVTDRAESRAALDPVARPRDAVSAFHRFSAAAGSGPDRLYDGDGRINFVLSRSTSNGVTATPPRAAPRKTDLTLPEPPPAAAESSAAGDDAVSHCRQALADSPRPFGYGLEWACAAPGGPIAAAIAAGVEEAVADGLTQIKARPELTALFVLIGLLPKLLELAAGIALATTGVGAPAALPAVAEAVAEIFRATFAAMGLLLSSVLLGQIKKRFLKLLETESESVEFYASLRALTRSSLAFAAVALMTLAGFSDAPNSKEGIAGTAVAAETSTALEYAAKETRMSEKPDPAALPEGRPTPVPTRGDWRNRNAALGENRAALVLARSGYKVEQLIADRAREANPDYLIEGKHFDCYTPQEGTPAKNIHSVLSKKARYQADRIVLNADNLMNPAAVLAELARLLKEHPIDNLKEVIVVQGDGAWNLHPLK